MVYSIRFRWRNVVVDTTSWVSTRAIIRAPRGSRISLGQHCEIHPYAMILSYGGYITIGDNVSVNPFTVIYGIGDVKIGSGVRIATSVTIIPANHIQANQEIDLKDAGITKQGIRIEDNVWIGAGARILDGVTIGRDSVVGAGSVVTRNVARGSTVVGVSARPLVSSAGSAQVNWIMFRSFSFWLRLWPLVAMQYFGDICSPQLPPPESTLTRYSVL